MLATLLLLSPALTTGDELRYLPAENAETRYSFTETTDLRMTYLRSVTNGQEHERTDFQPTYRQQTARRWTDRVVRAGDGRDDELVREVHRAAEEFTLEIEERGKTVTGRTVSTSEVAGARVRFEWNEAAGDYVGTLADADGAADPSPVWLAGLEADTTGRAFLPPSDMDDVAPGSQWEVEASALSALLAPGGRMAALYGPLEGAEDPDLLALYGSLSAARLTEEVGGTARARWRSTVQDDGRTYAIIDLTFDLEVGAVPTAWMQEQSKPYALALMGQGARDARIDARMEGTASILWDVDRGCLLNVTLRSENDVHVALDYSLAFGNTNVDGKYEFDLEGATAIEIEARR
ncbi:MAG: hypothetical protein AAGI22_22495 [Planctomycetota bacterium]